MRFFVFVASLTIIFAGPLAFCLFLPQTALLIVLVSLLALVLVLTEFTFIKKVSSLSLCIIAVVKVSPPHHIDQLFRRGPPLSCLLASFSDFAALEHL